ncbi:hypothetical protein [uncultured Psychroserpens sp.]|uniref:hypothetical protein n=1 Tax=uncultured Psychroserpens sp. TaxID=255436 RepID=UPI002623D0D4|nr:hypothetical protein [uncultured Psychroserpens sp.]
MSNIIKKGIIQSPIEYFDHQSKSLEERLEDVKLTEEQENEIVADKTVKTIREKTLGLFKIGDLINTVLNWNDEIDNDLKEAKKEYLMNSYFQKTDQTEESIKKIKELLTSPQGNTIFNKILRILDNTPPDLELTEHLSNVLKNIVDTDFVGLFEDHKFAINQIEMLTPQALTLLSDYSNWENWKAVRGYFSSDGVRISSNWSREFVNAYSASKGIINGSMKSKISNSMNDLIKNQYVEGRLIQQSQFCEAFITDIGKLIIKYLK